MGKSEKKYSHTPTELKIVLSYRAIAGIMVETRDRISTETGGLFLGHRCENTWYILEAIDPGPNSIFQTSYFEYDTPYVDHLINKVNKLYRYELDLIGLWHRHPGSMDTFSFTDDSTNTEYAKLDPSGAISALVNVNPEFKLTMYRVTMPLHYTRISYLIGDETIPAKYLKYVTPEEASRQIKERFKENGTKKTKKESGIIT